MSTALNGICPYFTMFPLAFPEGILTRHAKNGEAVLDPFAGRGTTLYAARLKGLRAYGIDSNPVAVAISEAKLANTTPGRITAAARKILADIPMPRDVPTGPFWKLAFDEEVLSTLCRLRAGLLANCESASRKALRAILLGALHGPRAKKEAHQSYFSNQSPRTYGPKPAYAVKFWTERDLLPPELDVLEVIARRAVRYYGNETSVARGNMMAGDSQQQSSFEQIDTKTSWIVTSPPYYGMRTYIPDQWLRNWLLGGPSTVHYSNQDQLTHSSKECFAAGLKQVWTNCAAVANPSCRLIVRFGAINDRHLDARELLKTSLTDTAWKILTCRNAGSASHGRRQADAFVPAAEPIQEYDVWATN
jgi:hypothetical protein